MSSHLQKPNGQRNARNFSFTDWHVGYSLTFIKREEKVDSAVLPIMGRRHRNLPAVNYKRVKASGWIQSGKDAAIFQQRVAIPDDVAGLFGTIGVPGKIAISTFL